MSALILALALTVAPPAEGPAAKLPPGPNPFGSYDPKAGDKAYLCPLFSDPDIDSVRVTVPLLPTYLEYMHLRKGEDRAGVRKMVEDRKVMLAKPGTWIEVIEPRKDLVEDFQYPVSFKFQEGPLKGRTAF